MRQNGRQHREGPSGGDVLDYTTIAITVLSAVGAALVTYGAMKTRIDSLDRKMIQVDTELTRSREDLGKECRRIADGIHNTRERFSEILHDYVTIERFETNMRRFDRIEEDLKRLIEMVAQISSKPAIRAKLKEE